MSNEITSTPAIGKKSYRVRVDMAFSMSKEFETASETGGARGRQEGEQGLDARNYRWVGWRQRQGGSHRGTALTFDFSRDFFNAPLRIFLHPVVV